MPIKSIPIELGGQTRQLRFTFNALCLLEDVLGLPISDIGQALSGSVRLTTIRSLLYAGLTDEDPTLSQKKVGELLSDQLPKIEDLADKIRQAFEGAFAQPEGEAEKKAKGTIPNPGTGESI